MRQLTEKNIFYLLLVLAILANLFGLYNYIFLNDSALYATIAKNMAESNNYWDLISRGKDWLDKPHFPFWISAFSFELFGINTLAYKIPAVFFALLSVWYTYQFAKLLYNEEVAKWSALILLTAVHFFLSNNDVRAEAYLVCFTIGGTYYFYQLNQGFNWKPLILGSLMGAAAIMTKGIFTIIPIYSAIFGHLILSRQYKALWHYKWLLSFILVGIFTLPEVIALYLQFDLHPEKEVFNKTGVSGIQFFLWDSQFGRFFNTGPYKGRGEPSFFIHTQLWAFFPWVFILFYTVFQRVRDYFRKPMEKVEYYCLAGAIPIFLLFSLSSFQLAHYTNIIYPFFAIMVADTIYNLYTNYSKTVFEPIQYIYLALWLLAAILLSYFFGLSVNIFLIASLVVSIYLFYVVGALGRTKAVFYRSAIFAIQLAFFLNLNFYPELLQYQSGIPMAEFLNKNHPKEELVVYEVDYGLENLAFHFNGKVLIKRDMDKVKAMVEKGPFLLYSTEALMKCLEEEGVPLKRINTEEHFRITMLKPEFINHETRDRSLEYRVVAQVGSN